MARSEHQILRDVLRRLVEEHGYSPDQLSSEVKMPGGLEADCIVYADTAREKPLVVVEVKQYIIYPIAVEQLTTYMKRIGAPYGMLTDGEREFYFRSFGSEIIEISNIPKEERDELVFKSSLLDTKISREFESRKVRSFDYVLQSIYDHIIRNEKIAPEKALEETQKLILCKLEDEQSEEQPLFLIRNDEVKEIENERVQAELKNRVDRLFEKVKLHYPRLYPRNGSLDLNLRTFTYCLAQLQEQHLSEISLETRSDAYERFIGRSLDVYVGQLFTPKPLLDVVTRILDPDEKERFIDPACGSGGFLVSAINYVGKKTENHGLRAAFASENVFGVDINPKMIAICRMNMVLQGGGWKHLYNVDFLSDSATGSIIVPESFDVIAVDPPHGSAISDRSVLEHFELGKGKKTQEILALFIEKCIKMLRPSGRMALIVPESLLTKPTLRGVREFLLKHVVIRAIVSFSAQTFVPYSGRKANIIFVQKKSVAEHGDYDIFVAEAFDSSKETFNEIVERYQKFLMRGSRD